MYVDKFFYETTQAMLKLEPTPDRTGTGCRSMFGTNVTLYDIADVFPILSLKQTPFRGALHELHWFLRGSSNIEDLHPSVKHWWEPWAEEDGSVGPIYGHQYHRNNQFWDTICQLQINPHSRRHVITLWNTDDIDAGVLPPCHGTVIQFHVDNTKTLHLQTYQRSADLLIGLPINIVSYAALLLMVAKQCGYKPGNLYYTVGNLHLYENHVEGAREMLTRVGELTFPYINFEDVPAVSDFVDKFGVLQFPKLIGYEPYPSIHLQVAV